MRNIIIIHGKKGAGKDTCADYICQAYGFQKFSLSDPLKQTCRDIVNSLVMCNAPLAKFYDQEVKEKPIAMAAYGAPQQMHIPTNGDWESTINADQVAGSVQRVDMTPRRLMQYIGTDVLRKHFGCNVHVNAVIDHIRNHSDTDWVIPDARFVDEIESIFQAFRHSHKITTIHLIRPDQFKSNNSVDNHISEQPIDWPFDTIICNDSTMADLIGEVDYAMDFITLDVRDVGENENNVTNEPTSDSESHIAPIIPPIPSTDSNPQPIHTLFTDTLM